MATLIQTVHGQGTGTTNTAWTTTVTLTNVTTGNMIYVAMGDDSGGVNSGLGSITDSAGNTYVKINSAASSGAISAWYAKNVTGATSLVITTHAATTNGTSSINYFAQEWSGLDTVAPLDQSGTNSNGSVSSAAPSASTSSATTNAADLVIVSGIAANSTTTMTAGAGMSNFSFNAGGNPIFVDIGTNSKAVVATGVQSGTLALSPADFYALSIAAFKTVTPVTLSTDSMAISFPSGGGTAGYVKVNVAGSWTKKPVKVNVAGSWVVKPVKRWNGTTWVSLT